MGSGSSQKFIARNRAPRVQIEYDVELYGSEKKVHLPFVQGVMAELQDYHNADYQDPVIDTDEFGSKYWQPEHDAYWDSATVH